VDQVLHHKKKTLDAAKRKADWERSERKRKAGERTEDSIVAEMHARNHQLQSKGRFNEAKFEIAY